jgi:hypothetical protein
VSTRARKTFPTPRGGDPSRTRDEADITEALDALLRRRAAALKEGPGRARDRLLAAIDDVIVELEMREAEKERGEAD